MITEVIQDLTVNTSLTEGEVGRDIAVHLENVSVRYKIPMEPIRSFKEYMIRRLKGQVDYWELWALRGVSLDVRRGEVFGIIGRNGSGKSTLLKVMARVLKPTTGRVWMKGRVVPLLELGAGFHPELTGRENIYLNATLLGYSRAEIEKAYSSIVEFAEIGDFINAPLRTYSSGMVARLGFAVAMAWQPDILLIDELLAVGDEAFQQKCKDRIAEFQQQGVTVLLVSHDLGQVAAMCQRAMWLDHGEVQAIGEAEDVVEKYRHSNAV